MKFRAFPPAPTVKLPGRSAMCLCYSSIRLSKLIMDAGNLRFWQVGKSRTPEAFGCPFPHHVSTAGGHHTQLGWDERLGRYKLVTASNCERTKMRRDDPMCSDVRGTPFGLLATGPRLSPIAPPSSLPDLATTWGYEISSVYHGGIVEHEVKPGARLTPSKEGRLTWRFCLPRNQTSGLDPRSRQHLSLRPHETGNQAVCEQLSPRP